MHYLTTELPGTGGRIKVHPADFCVTEIPLYEPSGAGDHVYLYIEKQGIGSLEAAERIARALGRPRQAVGIAGLKDAQAVTRQWMSIERAESDQAARLHVPGITVLTVSRHRNKLKIGHLAGNRFEVRIRGCRAGSRELAERILRVLAERGVPNWFDRQRFGRRGDNHVLGRALVLGKYDEFCRHFLGRPTPDDPPRIANARRHFDAGRLVDARKLFTGCTDHLKVLSALMHTKSPERAAHALPKQLSRLLVGAFQSEIFNAVLERRIGSIDRVEMGDLAYVHPHLGAPDAGVHRNSVALGGMPTPPLRGHACTDSGRTCPAESVLGMPPPIAASCHDPSAHPAIPAKEKREGPPGGAVFLVDRPEDEAPRAARFEISPSGPIVGHRVTLASGRPGEIEHAVLAEKGIAPADFERVKAMRLRGDRRPLRVPIAETEVSPVGDDITVRFTLPSGAYATIVLAEIMKSDI